MRATDLKPGHFASYPPKARELAVSNLALLHKLPDVFVPILLREVITYDWKFPAERKELENQFSFLTSLSTDDMTSLMAPFGQFAASAAMEQIDWVKSPTDFAEALTASLWATHKIDSFTAASEQYAASLRAHISEQVPIAPRLVIVVLGEGVAQQSEPLFRRLLPFGVHFNNITIDDGLTALRKIVAARARRYPEPYGHWYIDGDMAGAIGSEVATISYAGLEAPRQAIVRKMETTISSGDAGPEHLRSLLAQMKPQEVGLDRLSRDPILQRFQLSLLTEGSGTQIFSTTFVQWAAREVLRRAQPLTLLVRFTPRQRQRSFEELLATQRGSGELDPAGSLIDAEMGAYYTWLNERRLSGSKDSSFLVWFEGHSEALAITPSLPGGTQSPTPMGIDGLMNLLA